MKVSLICTESWTEVIPESEITFVDCYGHKNGETLKIPASTLNYYKGQMTGLGFLDFQGKALHVYSGNGGLFSVFVMGHNELLEDSQTNEKALRD